MGSTVNPPLVYIDANLLISAMEGPGAVADHAWWILEAIERGDIRGCTSELTLAEVLVHPLRNDDESLARAYEQIVSPSDGFDVIPVARGLLIEAARLRARHHTLRLPDAVHLASAIAAEAEHFLTRDARLAAVSPIPVLDGGPHTLDLIEEATR